MREEEGEGEGERDGEIEPKAKVARSEELHVPGLVAKEALSPLEQVPRSARRGDELLHVARGRFLGFAVEKGLGPWSCEFFLRGVSKRILRDATRSEALAVKARNPNPHHGKAAAAPVWTSSQVWTFVAQSGSFLPRPLLRRKVVRIPSSLQICSALATACEPELSEAVAARVLRGGMPRFF